MVQVVHAFLSVSVCRNFRIWFYSTYKYNIVGSSTVLTTCGRREWFEKVYLLDRKDMDDNGKEDPSKMIIFETKMMILHHLVE